MTFDFNKLLSTLDIQDIASQYLGIEVWVYSRDDMPDILDKGFYVINLDGKAGPGTHWVSFIKANEDDVIYFDSFGFPPSTEQLDAFLHNHDRCYHNKRQIQDIDSILCGYYCLAFFHHFLSNYQKVEHPKYLLQSFAQLFTDNTKKNDAVLKKYIKNIQ